MRQGKIFRVIDANFNRAKEGLRVCEDVARFVLDEKEGARGYKEIRHALSGACLKVIKQHGIGARSIATDVGRATISPELKRASVKDVFYANSQRAKESIRVLEEFFKLTDVTRAVVIKRIRYRIYALEQKIFRKLRG